ncbi:hypothetical protein DFS34DRAFT_187067 [Phlyctochytrium arcticum]|nr:hypothetical protein DFS34DRAFT_187067 [Phlyctochytrium arcticum]
MHPKPTFTTPPDWPSALNKYNSALTTLCSRAADSSRGDRLRKLDDVLWGTMRETVRDRGHMDATELKDLMEWKLSRGKFRPTLMSQITSNPATLVQKVTSAAYAVLKNVEKNGQILAAEPILKAIKICVELKGCGPATASAILKVYNDSVPFMSDEVLATFTTGKLQYTISAYKKMLDGLIIEAEELNDGSGAKEWTPGMCERAVWAWNIVENESTPKGATKYSDSEGVNDQKTIAAPGKRPTTENGTDSAKTSEDDDTSQTARRQSKRLKSSRK